MKIKLKFVLVLLLLCNWGYSQLSNFNLSVTATNETCTDNGSLTFSVSNTISGSTIVYSIYLLPNATTPIAVLSANSLSGLGAGTYHVVATQSLGNQSGTQSQDVIILDQVEDLTYQVVSQKEVCGNDGSITVLALTGNPSQYEIFAGPMTMPLQSSNVFNGLVAGQYQVRVFDLCNEGVVQTHTVQSADPTLEFTLNSPTASGCTNVTVGFSLSLVSATGIIKYPLQIQTTVFSPTGGTIVTNSVLTSGADFATNIQLFSQQPYNYSFVITDACGNSYSLNGTVNQISTAISHQLLAENCETKRIRFINVTALQLISAPASYPNPLPQNLTSQIDSGVFTSLPLPVGTYVFTATGLCGQQENFTIQIVLDPIPPYSFQYNVGCQFGSLAFYNVTQIVLISAPSSYTGALPYNFTSTINAANIAVLENVPIGNYVFNVVDICQNTSVLNASIVPTILPPQFQILKSCSDNKGSIRIYATGQLYSLQLISAPTSFGGILPQNFTSLIVANSEFTMNNLPSGNYVFVSSNFCSNTSTLNIAIPDYQESVNVEVFPNCGSFDLELNYSVNGSTNNAFWLQKYYPLSNSWGHPSTGVLFAEGTSPTVFNSLQLTNNTTTYNLTFTGQFRVVKRQQQYVPGSSIPENCVQILYEFEYDGQPKIIDVFSVSCNTTFEVVVDAEGLGPLIYRITTKNGLPFVVENGTANLFTNLSPAVYNFQVEDICGNILNSSFEVNIPNPLEITPTVFCPGQPGSLTLPNFAFLEYSWWKDSATTTILSSANNLQFNSFNPLTDAGTYFVTTMYNGNPNSCLNTTTSFTISADGFNPLAGDDVSHSYCGNQGVIDLMTLLEGNYTTNGFWVESTFSGALIGTLWDSTAVLPGIYQFNYRVNGNCDLFDLSQLVIEIKAIPTIPIASVDPVLCDGQVLNLYASSQPNANYFWTGPNNFTSTEQNPQITAISPLINGTYSVTTLINGCESGSASVEVVVNPLPEFEIEKNCQGSRFVLTASALNNSFDSDTAIFNWTGPNGYSQIGNPIDITGNDPGDYVVDIIDDNGCSSSKTINVIGTFCEIPNIITPNDDGLNDSFDLSGLGVVKFEVYNRYGRKVYEAKDYFKEWYGQNLNNQLLPDSTYYYIIEFKDSATKTGWVLVNAKEK